MNSSNILNFIEEYWNSNKYQQKLLQKKYGIKQIQLVAKKFLVEEYLKVYIKFYQ